MHALLDEGAALPIVPRTWRRRSSGSAAAAHEAHAAYLRTAEEPAYEKLKGLCHTIGSPVIAPLAEALSPPNRTRGRGGGSATSSSASVPQGANPFVR